MSCHGIPGNRAATSLACALTHTPSDEVSRRFHELKREVPADMEAPSLAEVEEWFDRQALAIRTEEGLSAWRRERLLARIEEARAEIAQPDPATWYAWQNVRAACDDAHAHAWLADTAGVDLPLTEHTPDQIDERLGQIWGDIYHEIYRKGIIRRDIEHAERNLGRYGITEADLDRRRASLVACEEKIDKLLDQTAPYEAEYARRGGWSRYYRVETSGQGHVHSSRDCFSCYPTTQYSWLPSLSGKGQDEAVDDYGSEMCSHCFPGVLSHPSYQSRGRIAEEVIARRAAEEAQRTAARNAKGITTPDGSPLVVGSGRFPDRINSEVTAERTLVERLTDLKQRYSAEKIDADVAAHAARIAADGPNSTWRPADEYRSLQEEKRAEHLEDVRKLSEALAAKRGQSADEVLSSVETKVANRIKREEREARKWAAQHPNGW